MFSSFSKILKTKKKGAVVRPAGKQPFLGSGILGMTTKRRKKLLKGPGSVVLPGYSTCVMADWACLPHDVLVLIVKLVKKIRDLAAFATVCKSWHAAATKDHFKALWLRERTFYLMLPLRDGNTRDLYSLAEGEIVASVRVPNLSERKCYESLGWFLAVEEDGSACLLDPFSTTEILLPHLKNLPYFSRGGHIFVKKMVLSTRPTDPSDPSNFIVALIFRSVLGVAFWKPGDKSWHLTRFEISRDAVYEDITYHAGNFYVFDERYQVTSFNILNGFPERGQIIAPYREPGPLYFGGMNVYLVKMPGSLLLVSRTVYSNYGNPYNDLEAMYRNTEFDVYRTIKFEVYEFQISSNTWRKINNLGNIALFLGSDIATTIVDASRFPGFVKANHIYFTDDGERNPFDSVGKPEKAVTGQDMGVYNLGNGRIDPFYHGEAFNSKVSHPAWIFPFLWSSTADEMHTL